MQNFMGNLAGIVAPALTGKIVDLTGEFFWPFLITAGMSLVGLLSWTVFVGPVRQVAWKARDAVTAVDLLEG